MSNRRLFLRNVRYAYPGTLGVPTDKGIQDVKPLPLEAPTESYEIMLLRWQTGVFEVGADAPEPPPPEPEYPEMAFNLQQQLISLGMPSPTAKELALQLTTGNYNANRLIWAAIPGPLAMYLVESFSNGTYDPNRAVGLGMVPAIAALLEGGGVRPPYPAPFGFDWAIVTQGGRMVTQNDRPVLQLRAA